MIDLNDYGGPVPVVRSGIPTYDDFVFIAPQGKAMFRITQELWPANSVNAVLPCKNIDDKKIKPSDWLARNQFVSQITWLPGEPEVILDKVVLEGGVESRAGFRSYNLYRAPDIQIGDPRQALRWLRHIRQVYPNDFRHIVAWFAHLVQKPNVKINHSIVLGGAQGIGKDSIVKPVIEAVGRWNSITISPSALTEKFNEFARVVLLYINEMRDLGDQTRYQFYETLKPYAAAPPLTTRINEKFLRPYRIPNLVGVVQNSNYLTDGLYLPADDRRHFVAWSDRVRDDFPKDYWEAFHTWLDAEGNGHVAAFLRNLDISGFDPKAPPPQTPAFWEIVNANRPPEDADIENLLDLMKWPDALTLDDLRDNAIGAFGDFLRERKHFRMIVHRLEAAGYRAVRNQADRNKGFWKIGTRRQPVYAKASLSQREQFAAAHRLRRSRHTHDGSP
jgi:hypothetical protein